jgi:hypothetical protein
VSIEWYKFRGEGRLRHRNQLEVAIEVIAQDFDVAVHPQPPILDGEREASTNDRQVKAEGDTLIIASASARDRELGKVRNFSINSDGEGLLSEVDDDEHLQKMAVSTPAQNHWHVS